MAGGGNRYRRRLNKLDDLQLLAGQQRKLTALVARDGRLLRLPLTLPDEVLTARLLQTDAAKGEQWLAGTAAVKDKATGKAKGKSRA